MSAPALVLLFGTEEVMRQWDADHPGVHTRHVHSMRDVVGLSGPIDVRTLYSPRYSDDQMEALHYAESVYAQR